MRKILKIAALSGLLILAVEGLVAAGLSHPARVPQLPTLLSVLLRGVYLDGARNIIQFEPDCARYDSGLSYTLKPGQFTFSNAEFKTVYSVNSQGLRSAESDLKSPDVIVIGDSRAMGWGVAQEALYSHVLADKTGLKILNAAVSSYGTVREMKLLDRLDTTTARYLIVHYVDNDYGENAHYFKNSNHIQIMNEDKYRAVQKKYLQSKKYFFGKYTFFVLFRIGAEIRNSVLRLLKVSETESDALYFLNALTHARQTRLDGMRLVLLGPREFMKRVRRELAGGEYPEPIENAILIHDDVPAGGYFNLDNHMNDKGHRLLAGRLSRLVQTGHVYGRH